MPALALILALASCGPGNGNGNCSALACASAAGHLRLTLVDAAGGAIPSASFSDLLSGAASSTAVTPTCATTSDGGACTVFEFSSLSEGSQKLTITAQGYVSQSITFTIAGPVGCCGTGPEVDESVELDAQ